MKRSELVWETGYFIYSLGEVVWARQEILSTDIINGSDSNLSEKNVWELPVLAIGITKQIERVGQTQPLKVHLL